MEKYKKEKGLYKGGSGGTGYTMLGMGMKGEVECWFPESMPSPHPGFKPFTF